jgi:hypothetical protein
MLSYRFQIETPLPPEVVIQRIREITRDPPDFRESIRLVFARRGVPNPPFFGKIEGQSFRLRRDIRNRKSFLPQIRGNVQQAFPGSRIDVTMSLHPATLLFMLFWLGGVGIAAVVAFVGFMSSDTAGDPVWLIPLGMFILGIVMTLAGFIPEARMARRLLEEALKEQGGVLPPANGGFAPGR